MLYLCNPSSERIIEGMLRGRLGMIDTPAQRQARPAHVWWCADNGCYGKGFPGEAGWYQWLTRQAAQRDRELCLFAVAPDVVADHAATWERSRPWLPRIRELGLPAAFVAQDGMTLAFDGWDELDVLFIGGSTEWKLSDQARDLVREAKRRGKHVHMGRVNSRKRLRIAKSWGVDSCDGTLLTYGPDKWLPPLLRWLGELDDYAPERT